MKTWIKTTIFWIIAVIITLGASVYQRLTGPTYPLRVKFVHENVEYSLAFPRTHEGTTDLPVEVELPEEFSGNVIFRRFPTSEPWDTIALARVDDNLVCFLPNQPPAGKLEYHLELNYNGTPVELDLEENIVARFKGEVPAWALIPHIFFMFFAMLWSNATGLQAAAGIKAYKRNAIIATGLFLVGGMMLGPIVQKFAFDAYWTGWPFGEDLTDNKVLASVIVWILAIVFNRKKDRPWLVIVAAVFLFIIYMIPHSMRGSEFDYSSGEVITGGIILLGGTKLKKRICG